MSDSLKWVWQFRGQPQIHWCVITFTNLRLLVVNTPILVCYISILMSHCMAKKKALVVSRGATWCCPANLRCDKLGAHPSFPDAPKHIVGYISHDIPSRSHWITFSLGYPPLNWLRCGEPMICNYIEYFSERETIGFPQLFVYLPHGKSPFETHHKISRWF